MARIALTLFGGFEARLPNGRLAEIGTRKAEALLAFLACRPGDRHSRDRLAALLWSEGTDQGARHSLRQALASLRRTLPADVPPLRADRDIVVLEPAAVDVDVDVFEERSRSSDPSSLEAAVELYRGPLLDGFSVHEDPFEAWLKAERARLEDKAVLLLLRLAEVSSDDERAERALRRAIEIDPLREAAYRQLIGRALRVGQFNAAIRCYRTCAEVLDRELGVAPEPQTTALYNEAVARIRGAPAAVAQPLPDIVGFMAERKQVSVLCAAFSPISLHGGSHDPEETQDVLGPALDELQGVAARNDASVVNKTADEFTAIFGAPLALESHAAKACRAAVDMIAAVNRRVDFPFRASIAIDSGELVVQTRDRALVREGLFGHCLRRAAQLARSGAIHEIGVTEATAALADRAWHFGPIDAVPLGPDATFVNLCAPLAPRRGSSVLSEFPARPLSRFVGRQNEMDAIADALARASAGEGQIVAAVGEPGMGKSRLFYEFIRRAPSGWRVITARGDPQLADAPYRPIAYALGATLGIAVAEPGHERYDALARAVLALDPALEPSLPALASLLELGRVDPAWDGLEPAQKRRQIVHAASLVFRREADQQPVLLVVEDLHWLDLASRGILERVVELLPGARMVLIVNYRPDFSHGWAGRSFYRQINLGPLSPAQGAEFVDALLGENVSVGSLRASVLTRAGGNPFFIEECIRSVEQSGAIAGSWGAFEARGELENLALPETVQAVIAARIDQLALADKVLLGVASVIGNEVSYELLQSVAALDEDALRDSLARLQASEFLVETSVTSSTSYRFKHALTNEVAYVTLLQKTRRELHGRVMTALEEQRSVHFDEDIDALAYHAARGDVPEKAADYGRRAGLKAAARSANRAAVAHFREALSALTRLSQTQARMTEEIDMRFEMRNTLFVLGEHDLILEHLKRAELLAERTDDALRRGYAALQMGGWFWVFGQQQASRDASRRALQIARDCDDAELTALAWYRIGASYHASGDYRTATDALARSASMLEKGEHVDLAALGGYPYAFCCSFLSWSLAELGDFASSREWGLRGLQLASERNHTYTQTVVTFGLGLCYIREGCFDEANALLARCHELYEAGDVPVAYSWTASLYGFTCVARGDVERGFELLHRAIALDSTRMQRSQLELLLADACLLTGRNAEAFEAARRAHLVAHEHGQKNHIAWAERVLGDVAAETDPGAALAHYERAIELARALGLRPVHRAASLGRARLPATTPSG